MFNHLSAFLESLILQFSHPLFYSLPTLHSSFSLLSSLHYTFNSIYIYILFRPSPLSLSLSLPFSHTILFTSLPTLLYLLVPSLHLTSFRLSFCPSFLLSSSAFHFPLPNFMFLLYLHLFPIFFPISFFTPSNSFPNT